MSGRSAEVAWGVVIAALMGLMGALAWVVAGIAAVAESFR